MRTLTLTLLLAGQLAHAQAQGGNWGGYVTGWSSGTRQRPPLVWVPNTAWSWQYAAQSAWYNEQVAVQRQLEAQRAQAAAQSEQLAAEQRRLEAERLAQDLARQEQELARQERDAARRAELLELEAAQRERLIREDERRKVLEAQAAVQRGPEVQTPTPSTVAPTAPPTKGPTIHKWVDEDGVIHYSTKPRRR